MKKRRLNLKGFKNVTVVEDPRVPPGHMWATTEPELVREIRGDYFIREEEVGSWSSTGKAYRAFWAETSFPLHVGAETREAAEKRVAEFYPLAVLVGGPKTT